MELWLPHSDQVHKTIKSFPVSRNMPALDRSGVTRIVSAAVVQSAACYFGWIEKCRHHGRADLVGTTNKPLTRFMRRRAEQSLTVIRIDEQSSEPLDARECRCLKITQFCCASIPCHELERLNRAAGT